MPPFKWASLALGAAIATSAQAGPLTYEQALARAGDAPTLRARALSIEAAQSAARAAGRLPDPRLTFGLDNFPISGPMAGRLGDDEMTMARVGVMQDITNSDERRASAALAKAEVSATRAEGEVEAVTIRAEAALAWIDLYYAKRRLAALDEIVKTLEPLVEAAPAGVASGRTRPAQTVEPVLWLAKLADRRSELLAEVGRARAALTRWTGEPDADAAGATPQLHVDSAALKAGIDHHPFVARYAADSERAAAEVAKARAAGRPEWSWEVSYGRRDPTFGDMLSVGATVRLPVRRDTRQAPLIAARRADVSRVEAQAEAARRELTAALDADLADHVVHHDQLERARITLLPLAQRRADLETASYAAGTANLDDVFAAFSALADTRLDLLQREAATVRDAARLNLTYGSHPL